MPSNLIRVAGYAASEPLIKKDPYDPRNRRISILLFNKGDASAPPPFPTPRDDESAATGTKQATTLKPDEIEKKEAVKLDPIQQYLFKH